MKENVIPWAFLHTEHGVNVTNFYGNRITFKGLAFDGSIQEIYWNRYIEPFFEDFATSLFQEVAERAKRSEREISPDVFEAAELLKLSARRVFEEMAEQECRLVKPGFPDYSTARSITPKAEALSEVIDGIANATIASHPKYVKKMKIEILYEKRPFFPWLVVLGVAVAALVVSLSH